MLASCPFTTNNIMSYSRFDDAHCTFDLVVGRLNEEYQQEQDRQEKKRQDDVKAREAKSRRAYEVCARILHIGSSWCMQCWNGCWLHVVL